MSKLVCGVGVNDAWYVTQQTAGGLSVNCPAYRAWSSMIKRCYGVKQLARNPTYKNVTVCDDWCTFSKFRAWWLDNQRSGWQLDKDLLTESKVYSPETCIYIPQWLNKFTTDGAAARGDYPIGVDFGKASGRYRARCRHSDSGPEHLGWFDSPEDAHSAWLARKLAIARELKPRMDAIDARIYDRVIAIIRSKS